MADIWTSEDSQAAHPQGWDVFEASVDGKIVLLIERCDEMDIFKDDFKAVEFVKQQAAAGNLLAVKALRLDHECGASTPAAAAIIEFLEGAGFTKSQASSPHEDQTVYLLGDDAGNSLQFNYAPNGLPSLPAWKFCAYKAISGELQSLPLGGAVTPHDIRDMVAQFAASATKPQDAPRLTQANTVEADDDCPFGDVGGPRRQVERCPRCNSADTTVDYGPVDDDECLPEPVKAGKVPAVCGACRHQFYGNWLA